MDAALQAWRDSYSQSAWSNDNVVDGVFQRWLHLDAKTGTGDHLETLVQYCWPKSSVLRARILKSCFNYGFTNAITRPIRIVAHCLARHCMRSCEHRTLQAFSDMCVTITDGFDNSSVFVCGVNFYGVKLFDISPLCLQQIMDDDGLVTHLQYFASFPTCSAAYVDPSFKATTKAKTAILENLKILPQLLPLCFSSADGEDDIGMLIVDLWFMRRMDTAEVFSLISKGRELELCEAEFDLLLTSVLSYTPSLDRTSRDFNPEVDCGLRKEEMLLSFYQYLPKDNEYYTPSECCILYEAHFGSLPCKHPVCYSCFLTADRNDKGKLECPLCRVATETYTFAKMNIL